MSMKIINMEKMNVCFQQMSVFCKNTVIHSKNVLMYYNNQYQNRGVLVIVR